MAELPRTARTTGKRLRDRYRTDTSDLYAVLDEALLCHVSYVHDAEPRVIPTLYVRVGHCLYMHASTGSTLALHAREGIRVAVAVTLMDALVLARSGFHHSANYRSAVVHATATLVRDESERAEVLDAFVDRATPGRSAVLRRPTADELAATAVVKVPLDEESVKVRAHGVGDDPQDTDAAVWAGLIPLRQCAGTPIPDGERAATYAAPQLAPFLL